jgi:Cu-Zn family superoxide dismutase
VTKHHGFVSSRHSTQKQEDILSTTNHLFGISGHALAPLSIAFSAGLLCVACSSQSPKAEEPAAPAAQPATVSQEPGVATFEATGTSKIKGTVQFIPQGNELRVTAEIDGLEPNTLHGFHVHEVGDCTGPDFKKAGPHFNPTGEEHGSMDAHSHHAGDLNNLKADKKGHASYSATIASPKAPVASLVGRAVIIHKKADDLKTQPSGDSGDRIACALIMATKK